MSEIKFACPHCGQHIACNPDYADMCIVCPTCHQPMEVPRLDTAGAAHPDIYLVASIPKPRQRLSSRIPTIDLWREREWEAHYLAAAEPAQQTPARLVCAGGTLIAAMLLRAGQQPLWAVVACVAIGTVLSCVLLAKGKTVAAPLPGLSGLSPVLSIVVWIGLLLLAIPGAAVVILFVGCTACGGSEWLNQLSV
jgi:hypothetical protein